MFKVIALTSQCRLENLSKNVKEQSDISWSELCWGKWAVKDLKKHWRAAKSNIEDVESMTLIGKYQFKFGQMR